MIEVVEDARAGRRRVETGSEDETARLAASVAALARPGDVIALRGGLGAGKTAFARGFIRALAGPDEEVPSPTFTLLQTYETEAGTIYHFDLYRIEDPDELDELGLEEALADGITLIEWAERAAALRGERWLEVEIGAGEGGPDTRRIELVCGEAWRQRIGTMRHAPAGAAHG